MSEEKLLDWVEGHAIANINFQLQCADDLLKESNTLLRVLIGGISGTFVLAVQSYYKSVPVEITIGFSIATLWLMVTATILTLFCVITSDIYAANNEPRNLLSTSLPLDKIKRLELDNIQSRIDITLDRNANTAYWLDVSRRMLLLSPFVFIVAISPVFFP